MKMTINSIRFRFDLVSGISSAMDYQAALCPALSHDDDAASADDDDSDCRLMALAPNKKIRERKAAQSKHK